MKMDRPRRSYHLPVSLSDYMIVKDEADLQSDGNELKIDCDFVDSVSSEDESEKELREKKEKICQKQPYKCEECKAQYRSKAALLRHSVQHKGESPFLCTECEKGLSSQYALSEHMNIHTNSKPHKCETCGHESRQLSVHLRHLLTHSTKLSKIYTCNICSKKFKQNEYLKKHMRKHTGEKPFTCSDCDKSFTCKSELNRHSKRHSNDKPFKCNICYQSFKMQHNLHSHMRQHSIIQELKCPNCPATFTKGKQLESHRKTHMESAQVLQVLRPNSSTLVVTSQGEDKRRLPIHYKFTLHKEGEDSSAQESFERKYLRINDNEIPLSLIIKSIGSGDSIKIKIPDDQRQHTSQEISLVSGFSHPVEIIEEGEVIHPEYNNEITHTSVDQSSNKDSTIEDTVEHSIECESLSVESLESHFLNESQISNYIDSPAPENNDYLLWLGTLSSLSKQLQPPLSIQICSALIDLTGKLQCFLVKSPSVKPMETFPELCKQSPDIRNENEALEGNASRTSVIAATLDSYSENPHYPICNDINQYQNLLQHYTILMQTLQSHFTMTANNIPHR